MSEKKPLELTIYPHNPKHLNTNWLTMYITPDGPMAAGRGGVLPGAKHFADAELAAEWWRADQRFQNSTEGTETEQRALVELATLYRFATTPHYFEAAA